VRRILVWAVAAVGLLGGFLYLLDPAAVLEHLRETDLAVFAVGLGAILAALASWSEATRRLFRATEVDVSRRRALLAYGAGAFGKHVLPMGNAGGPAVMAYAFDREVQRGYSRTLAVVVTAEFLSLVASVSIALAGVVLLLALNPSTARLRWLGVGVAMVALGLVVLGLILWYRRRRVTLALVGLAHLLYPLLNRVSPRFAHRIHPGDVSGSVERCYASIDAVTADRMAVASAFGLTVLGWICFSIPLYTGSLALGVPVSMALVLVLVPAAGLLTVVPLPGGLGGFELALTGLLTALAGIDLATAGAIVILYRLCSFWFFVLVGGLCAAGSTIGLRDLATPLGGVPTTTVSGQERLRESDAE
jgi:uncharacterized protein (TIRG00374 family)